MRILLSVAFALLIAGASSGADAATAPLAIPHLPPSAGALPVLHQHRVKPLAVAADEIALAITGYSRKAEIAVDAHGKDIPPCDLAMSLMLAPEAWRDRPLLYAPYLPLQKRLGLRTQWASLADIETARPYLMSVSTRKESANRSGEKLTLEKIDREALALGERAMEGLDAIAGRALEIAPLAATAEDRAWMLGTLAPRLPNGDDPEHPLTSEHHWRERLREVLAARAPERDAALARADIWVAMEDIIAPDPLLADVPNPRLADTLRTGAAWIAAVRGGAVSDPDTASFRAALVAAGGAVAGYPSSGKIAAEVAYLQLHPFTWTWICYILGGILVAVGMGKVRRPTSEARGRNAWIVAGIALTLLGVAFNVTGLGIRVYITSLGAVTNLYETLVYVALLCASLGLVFARISGNGLYAVAGGVAGGLCAMVGEAIPPDLGSHIGQLQPVLRSKFWLWTHVKTVVGSYAAFLLAWAMGNLVMARAAWRRRAVDAEETRMIYRCLQVGVVLIALGTLLGAVWADQAWGRFWGWDPKEVWALVILLTYLIPLHLRYAGVVGPNGVATWSVLGFLSVIMSWYGVNFLLGTGLHAYAFGNGGQAWVLSACAVQIAVTTVLSLRLARYAAAERDLPLPSAAAMALPPPAVPGH